MRRRLQTHSIHNLALMLLLLLAPCTPLHVPTVINTKHTHQDGIKTGPYLGRQNYRSLVFDSYVFADKSLLIKEIAQSTDKLLIITCPRKSGKTLNLNMLQYFFQIKINKTGHHIPLETNDAYRLFTYHEIITINGKISNLEAPLLISQQKSIMDEHFGKYPVIMVKLSDICYTWDYLSAVRQFHLSLCHAFREHEYLLEDFYRVLDSNRYNVSMKMETERRIRLFNNFFYMERRRNRQQYHERPLNMPEIRDGLYFLSETLHRYFLKKVIILIDDYDAPWSSTTPSVGFTGTDRYKILQFYQQFMKVSLLKNEHIEKVILTGIMPPLQEQRALFKEAIECNMYTGKYMEFYGYTPWEVKDIYNIYNVPELKQKHAKLWFGGYRVNRDFQIYAQLSFNHFLFALKFESQFPDCTDCWGFVENFVNIESFRKKLHHLINGKDVVVHVDDYHFTWQRLEAVQLHYFFNHSVHPSFQLIEDAFLYLHNIGMLTFDDKSKKDCLRVRFPNIENRIFTKRALVEYYERPLDFDMKPAVGLKLRRKFKKYVKNNLSHCVSFQNTFLYYLNLSPYFFPRVQRGEDKQDLLLLMLRYLTIDVCTYYREQQVIQDERPFAMLKCYDRNIIVTVSYGNVSSAHEVQKAKNHPNVIQATNSNKLTKYINLNIYPQKRLECYAEIEFNRSLQTTKATTKETTSTISTSLFKVQPIGFIITSSTPENTLISFEVKMDFKTTPTRKCDLLDFITLFEKNNAD